MRINLIIAITLSTVLSTICIADTIPNITDIRNKLTNLGYENVSAGFANDTLYLGYENRVYRWEAVAMAEITDQTMRQLSDSTILCLIGHKKGIPVITCVISKSAYLQYINGEINRDEFSTAVKVSYYQHQYLRTTLKNPSFNKFDIVVHPQFHAQFGNFSDPLESQVNIAPALNVSLWHGMNLTAQVIIPLQNDLEKAGDYIRPGLLTLTQTLRLPFNIFTSATAGYFTRNRYGIDLETRKFTNNGKVSAGFRIGCTGEASVMDGRWTYTEASLLTWFADASYRWARYDLTFRAGYGRFLDKDKGWRFDVYRQLGEISIGFYGIRSGGVLNGGFNFKVPLPPRRYSTKHSIRIRPAGNFAWEYRGKGLPREGKVYATDNGMDEYSDNLNPDYLKKLIVNKLVPQN